MVIYAMEENKAGKGSEEFQMRGGDSHFEHGDQGKSH